MKEIHRMCSLCGSMHIIEVPEEGYNKWLNGAAIQDALPKLSEDDRELLMSGICGRCFDRIFRDA